MAQEIRKSFHDELREIQSDVARLGAMVTDTIPRGTAVLLANDPDGAQAIIEHDAVLDRLTLEIEEQCYQVLALQQPVAGDLRAIATGLRLTSEIERSGDLVVNIVKAARRIYASSLSPTIRGLLERMSEEAVRLYRAAMDAYLDGDADLAAAIDDMDDTLDDLQSDLIESIDTAHEGEGLPLAVAVQLALIARFYERIGDHAVNIGERVRYMVTGVLPELVAVESEGQGSAPAGDVSSAAPAAGGGADPPAGA